MKEWMQRAAKFLAPLVLVGLGAIGMFAMIEAREVPTSTPRAPEPLSVDVQRVRPQPRTIPLTLSGIVEPTQRISLTPRISGTIDDVAASVQPGRIVRKGDPLVRFDTKPLDLEIAALEAEVNRAKAQLEIEIGAGELAGRQWTSFRARQRNTPPEDVDPMRSKRLAFRQPQRESAEAALDAAQARLEQAKLTRARSTVSAPFDALIRDVNVALQQSVAPQTSLMSLVSIDTFRVRAGIPLTELKWLPDLKAGRHLDTPHPVQITDAMQGRWEGRLLGLEGEMDPDTRTAHAIIDVRDPLGLRNNKQVSSEATGLLLGSLVDVHIEGASVEDAVTLPERAIYQNRWVYLCDEEDLLRKREVTIAARSPGSVLIRDGLDAEERVVTTRLIAPVEGTRLDCEVRDE